MKLAYSLMTLIVLAILPGCGGADGGYCADVCDCTGDCSPNALDNCESSFEDGENRADKKDCSDRFDDAVDCYNTEFECNGNRAELNLDRCSSEIVALTQCAGITLGF